MDPLLIGIATATGGALVQAMAGDAWETTRERLAKILGRGSDDVEARMSQELDATAASLREGGSPSSASIEVERWTDILLRILTEHPDLARELQDFVSKIRQSSDEEAATVVQYISVRRDAYTAGRDQHISINANEDEH